MEKDESQNLNGSLLPPSGWNSGFPLDGNKDNEKSEPNGSTMVPTNCDESDQLTHDLSRMLDHPPKYLGHRRALSEIVTLPDDISFDRDLGVVGGFNGPSYSDETEEDLLSMYLDHMDKLNNSSATSGSQVGESSFSAVQNSQTAATPPASPPPENHVTSIRVKHQHSMSMDGSAIKPEMLNSGSEEISSTDAKKSISDAKLAELALVDPKHAKRIWANRQSAARSKERKMRYIAELERKVQILQTEASSCSAQLALLQRDTNGLAAENNELKLRLQTMKQQIHMQDAFNDALKEEIHRLKILTGQNLMNGGSMMNFRQSFGANYQFHPSNHAMNTQQFQQLQNQHPFEQQQLPLLHQIQQHPFQEQQLLQIQQKHQHPYPQQPGHRSSLST
ncbi:probable transcription factor PosF21 isoform X1 [Cynara cardunculus var. scolymus]|uniref:probable transcription factor PosF21 isoform X1 n=1 Tax=Cynara cardunculus var. scolymus TaxID=59895 RepID=UPI000D62FF30|nr:probable transcription factor PosF21 isoform X1 [Cynara cardunculus var. scolymus]XP_024983293.1 probable transcription factor PosF21 isoform X1 [Cynara cardunculus var. scolymus]